MVWYSFSGNFKLRLNFCSSGPEGTPLEDGIFVANLSFPNDYPLSPPSMKFASELFHPNSNQSLKSFKYLTNLTEKHIEFKFIRTEEFVYRFCIRLATIQRDMSRALNVGVQFSQ